MVEIKGCENIKRVSFFSRGCPHLKSFNSFLAVLNRIHSIDLTVPKIAGDEKERLSLFKQFCSGLIEKRPHDWHSIIRELPSLRRRSIAMSLFLFRKTLPSECPSIIDYMNRMSEECDSYDAGFHAYCSREIKNIFRKGWDRHRYFNASTNAVLPFSSCLQRKRSKGGCRLNKEGGRWNDHFKYVMHVLSEQRSDSFLPPSRVTAVSTAGKWRIVSVSDIKMNDLRPLHTAMYDHLSTKSWLLRGEATANRFSDFNYVIGENFYSGDYESATDNLNLHTQRHILNEVLKRCTEVPQHIKDLAYSSQSIELKMTEKIGRFEVTHYRQQRRGQLMGNLLSFPLLCLVNYLAFRYYGGEEATRNVPVKINGDDIVFRSTEAVGERWKLGVIGSGLKLSVGKTLIDGRYFSLNSKLFKSTQKKCVLVPIIRPIAFGFRKPESPVESLKGRWDCVKRDYPIHRKIIEEEFLRVNRPYIYMSHRSLNRGLDIRMRYESLAASGLWAREAFYLSLPCERPLPPSPDRREGDRIPLGWELRRVDKITKEMKLKTKEMGPEFVAQAWDGKWSGRKIDCFEMAKIKSEWVLQVSLSPSYFPDTFPVHKKCKLTRLSTANLRRWLKPEVRIDGVTILDRYSICDYFTKENKRVWLPVGFMNTSFVRPSSYSI
ncbi:RNA dependent RNA polymerase [Plasmopara viticola lesion associated ourmia-like virus 23]|uniref:RNA dependent RNA polymerase n=1 Tax=Plasmopara viticola lesion associated ourmia-like virus 23 TaxID=2686491 RepID=A0ABX6FIV0_9VIRU|nr:RNA dependent RNA polymerase [Plasmopara viticola lesion associated ourmia-like virus 23]QGY72553.1 RNA dependent RNA polymerase [Plasmopara viticola lesion associated ourmia-like virus 23]